MSLDLNLNLIPSCLRTVVAPVLLIVYLVERLIIRCNRRLISRVLLRLLIGTNCRRLRALRLLVIALLVSLLIIPLLVIDSRRLVARRIAPFYYNRRLKTCRLLVRACLMHTRLLVLRGLFLLVLVLIHHFLGGLIFNTLG